MSLTRKVAVALAVGAGVLLPAQAALADVPALPVNSGGTTDTVTQPADQLKALAGDPQALASALQSSAKGRSGEVDQAQALAALQQLQSAGSISPDQASAVTSLLGAKAAGGGVDKVTSVSGPMTNSKQMKMLS